MKYTDEEVIFKYIDNNYSIEKTRYDLGMGWETVAKILKNNDIEFVNPQKGKTTNLVDVGNQIADLLILERLENKIYPNGSQDKRFLCRCECGNELVIEGLRLRSGQKTHCGCKNKVRKRERGDGLSLFPVEPKIVKTPGKYKIGDVKDKLTILMKKSDGQFIEPSDELFVECECGVMSKMSYDEFMSSTCCGCDNNG